MASRELIGDAAASGSQAHDLSLDLRHIFELSLDLMCRPELVHPDDVEGTQRAHQSLIGGASAVEFENRCVRKDGEIVDLSSYAGSHPACRRIGTIRVANKRDGGFTETDERILAQLADLAAVGLENARLYAELEAFSYSVSHDLRGPRRAIAGFTGLLRDRHYETIDPEGRRYIDRVLAGTRRMSSLIDNLLELGRVTRAEIKWEPVDLSGLAQSIANRLRETAPARAATITIEPDLKVHGDLRLMEIALESLLDNAWKFTASRPDAQIRLGAQLERRRYRLLRTGQRRRLRSALRGEPVRRLSAFACSVGISRHRGRIGDSAADRAAPRRQDLGASRGRSWRHVLLHDCTG